MITLDHPKIVPVGWFSSQTRVLRVLLGYLAADRERRPLLIQVGNFSIAL